MAPNGISCPLNFPVPWRFAQADSPIRSDTLREWQKCLAAWGHHCGPKPLCSEAVRVPSKTARIVLSAAPLVGELSGVEVS